MKPNASQRRLQNSRKGSVLMMVLVAIVIMSLTTSTYLLLMRNEHTAARYSGNRLQTELLAQSGAEYLKVLLTLSPNEIEQQGGLINNPDLLQEVLVLDDPTVGFSGYFTVITSDLNQGYYENTRYGLENESAKLNLNTLLDDEDSSAPSAAEEDDSASPENTVSPRERLLMIPGMNEEVADAILDWLDEDDDPREFGAEAAHYQSLMPAYMPRNGLIAQLDDLLMVQGVTPELLYGLDVNRNFKIDNNELPRGALKELNYTNGEMNRGWSAYLTVHSSEKNINADGEPKIDLNDSSLEDLHQELSQTIGTAEANFLIAYRQYGPAGSDTEDDSDASSSNSGSTPGGNSSEGEPVSASEITIDFEKEGETQIKSMLDLIDARVLITEEDQEEGQQGGNTSQGNQNNSGKLLESPWTDDANSYRLKFAELLDAATADSETLAEGRININQASLPVLLTIPGMTEMLAEQILANRDATTSSTNGEQRHPVWLLADALVTLEEYKPMAKHITTRGDVFSGQVIGFFDAGTASSRGEVLLERSGEKTLLRGWRDLSPLGAGFSRSVLSGEPSD